MTALEFAGAAARLQSGEIEAEAAALGIKPAAIRAVWDIESAGAGFLDDGRPKILFEAHAFHTLTHGRYDARYPNISSPNWDRSLYGPGGAHQYARLEFALALDRSAGLQSASWGAPQIMGLNFAVCGCADIESFVAAMQRGEGEQLDAFVAFLRHGSLDRFLHEPPDFAAFARGYNGSGQVDAYAGKLAGAYRKWLAHPVPIATPAAVTRTSHPAEWHAPPAPLPLGEPPMERGDFGPLIFALQQRLVQLGFAVAQDGVFGPRTERAVSSFQQDQLLPVAGAVNDATIERLNAAGPR